MDPDYGKPKNLEKKGSLNESSDPGTESIRLLELINSHLALLHSGEPRNTYSELPKVEKCPVLSSRRLLMVDDSTGFLREWIPLLLVATGGNADFLLHRDGVSDAELLRSIVEKKPDLILLDYQLADGVVGENLVSPLQQHLPSCIIIGFSAHDELSNKILRAGAHGVAPKRYIEPETLRAISTIVSLGIDNI